MSLPAQKVPKGVNPRFIQLINGIYFDRCVNCEQVTDVRTDCLPDNRKYYIDGSGQLCEECFTKIYGSD